jgi:2'-5' RNA ligase
LTPADRSALADISHGVDPFQVAFRRVARFPRVVYLVPEPSAPIARLTAAVTARYPGHPPYGGAFEEVVPHLTVTESDSAPLDEIAAEAERWLPFAHRVTALEVLVESTGGRWRRHWRIPLGIRP